MKHSLLILASIAMAFLLASCSVSVPEKISRLADKVEKKGDKYSLEDWEKAAEKMENLLLEFADNYNNYKISEKADVVKSVARFTAKAATCGASQVLEELDLDDILDGAGSLMDGANDLIDSARGFLEGLGL